MNYLFKMFKKMEYMTYFQFEARLMQCFLLVFRGTPKDDPF